jgi:hypothetical protein
MFQFLDYKVPKSAIKNFSYHFTPTSDFFWVRPDTSLHCTIGRQPPSNFQLLATPALASFFLSPFPSHIHCPSYFLANQNARSLTARQQPAASRPSLVLFFNQSKSVTNSRKFAD